MYNYCWGAMIRILDVGGMLRRPGDLQVLWLPFDTCVSCVLGLRTAAGSFFSFWQVCGPEFHYFAAGHLIVVAAVVVGGKNGTSRGSTGAIRTDAAIFTPHTRREQHSSWLFFFFLFLPHHLSVMNDLFWAVLSSPVICIFHDRDVIPLVNALS